MAMISREKMFIVAGNVDDSIKAVTPVYDITVISTFVELEKFLEVTPIVLGTIIISANELHFTSNNMDRLISMVNSRFLELTGKCIYLIDEKTDKKVVSEFLSSQGELSSKIVCYQGDLSMQYISQIVDGSARDSDETEREMVTMRMRATEYVQSQQIQKYITDEEPYTTDEDMLADIPPVEEPITIIPPVDISTVCYYVVGKSSFERSLFAFLEAQYLSLTGKVFLMESDVEFHTLTEIVTKSGVDVELYDVSDLRVNITQVLEYIKTSHARIIVIGSKYRVDFDYDFLFDVLYSNLEGVIDYFIKECDFQQAPYSEKYTIVCEDTIPNILECVDSLRYPVNPEDTHFIGLRTRNVGPVNVSSQEMADILQLLLKNERIKAEVISAYGVVLRGEDFVYDLFSIIGRGNQR